MGTSLKVKRLAAVTFSSRGPSEGVNIGGGKGLLVIGRTG